MKHNRILTVSPNIPTVDREKIEKKLQKYRAHLKTVTKKGGYEYDEGSFNLPKDKVQRRSVEHTLLKLKKPGLKYIVVVGIGGSNLGTRALYEALQNVSDTYRRSKSPRMLFLDTVDEKMISGCTSILTREVKSAREILIVIVSKSGKTTETIVNTEVLLKGLQRIKNILSRVVVISDEDSPLMKKAHKEKLHFLPIPQKVGGRFSVFSAVGLFPLAAAGIKINKLLEGALKAHTASLSTAISKDTAARSALFQFYYFKKKKTISDMFLFHPELESLGKWYRQLMGESLGKEKNLSGKRVLTGINPTVTIGSTDLHSVGQLYMGGPRDKMTTFVTKKNDHGGTRVPSTSFFKTVDGIEGKYVQDILSALYTGVARAYTKIGLPFLTYELTSISEESLGEFMQMKMVEIMYLGYLMNVNTFDQPNVELYKKETQRILLK